MTSDNFLKMMAIELEIYSRPLPYGLGFSDSTRLAMSKSICTPNFDKIAQSSYVLILHLILENEHPPYLNYTSG